MKKATAIPIITAISNIIMKMNGIPKTVIEMNIKPLKYQISE